MKSERAYISIFGCMALQVGNIIGTGIYSAPTSIIDSTGSIGLALGVWVVTGLISITGGLVYSEIATTININGGDSIYVNFAGWRTVAFIFSVGQMIIIYPIYICLQALSFAQFLSFAFKWSLNNETHGFYLNFGIATSLLLLLLIANLCLKSEWLMYFNIAMASLKILFLCSIIVTACVIGNFNNFSQLFTGTTLNPDRIIQASYGAIFSFEGYDLPTLAVEEVKNSKRNLPLSTGITLSLIIVMYLLVNLAYFLILGHEQMLSLESFATINVVSQLAFGQNMRFIMPLIIAICLINSVNSSLFGISRIVHSMSRSKILPNCLSCWQEKLNSPRSAYFLIVFISILMLIGVDSSNFAYFNEMSVVLQWFQRCTTASLLLYIRFARLSKDEKIYRANVLFPCLYLTCMSAIIIGTCIITWTKAIIPVGTCLLAGFIYLILFNRHGLKRFNSYSMLLNKLEDMTNKITQWIFKCDVESMSK